ncbi:MAG TPA: TlpA disulfide reductase family protein [Acidothermaceae bacterium]
MLTHRYALRIALSALAIALLTVGLLTHASTAQRRAPALPSRALSGKLTTLADLHGYAAVVLFWAPDCAPCHWEAPAIERFARSARGRGRIVAIDDDYTSAWRKFLRDYDWTFPVLADQTLAVADAYRILGLPTAVFLDPDGRIASSRSGPQTVVSLTRGLSAAA